MKSGRHYDIIGDVHGQAGKLKRLLSVLGYREGSAGYYHPTLGRKAIFVGDLVDRGPNIREALWIVRNMVDSGNALVTMGNHEFNSMAYHTQNDRGEWIREHSDKNNQQHHETLCQLANPFPDEWSDWLKWFAQLPLFLDLGDIRVVHAAWQPAAIDFFSRKTIITRELMCSMASAGMAETDYKEILLNGLEVSLPQSFTYKDKSGHERGEIRTKWWTSFSGKKYSDIVFPDSDDAPDLSVEPGLENGNQYPQDAPPVFIGHYWLPATKKPEPIRHNIACVDYSAGKGGPLVAYRFDGERVLESRKFVAAE